MKYLKNIVMWIISTVLVVLCTPWHIVVGIKVMWFSESLTRYERHFMYSCFYVANDMTVGMILADILMLAIAIAVLSEGLVISLCIGIFVYYLLLLAVYTHIEKERELS